MLEPLLEGLRDDFIAKMVDAFKVFRGFEAFSDEELMEHYWEARGSVHHKEITIGSPNAQPDNIRDGNQSYFLLKKLAGHKLNFYDDAEIAEILKAPDKDLLEMAGQHTEFL